MKTRCLIYASPEEFQIVEIEYFFERSKGWFEATEFEIVDLTVLTPVTLDPSDLIQDLTTGIAEDLQCCESRVRITCKVEHQQEKDMMFIGGGEPVPNFLKVAV